MGDLFSKISLTEKSSPFQFIQNFWTRLKKKIRSISGKPTMRADKKPPEVSEYFLTFSEQKQIG